MISCYSFSSFQFLLFLPWSPFFARLSSSIFLYLLFSSVFPAHVNFPRMFQSARKHLGLDDDITTEQTVNYDNTLYNDRRYPMYNSLIHLPNRRSPESKNNASLNNTISGHNPLFSIPGDFIKDPSQSTATDRALASLDHEIDNESRLLSCVHRVQQNNAFLSELDHAAALLLQDSQKDPPKEHNESDYDTLRQEYLNELEQYQQFYKSYQSLILKYRDLRRSLSEPLSNSYTRAKQHISQLSAMSSTSTMKDLCEQALSEVEALNGLALSYKHDLDDSRAIINDLKKQSVPH